MGKERWRSRKKEPESPSNKGTGTHARRAYRWTEMGRRGKQGARRDAVCSIKDINLDISTSSTYVQKNQFMVKK